MSAKLNFRIAEKLFVKLRRQFSFREVSPKLRFIRIGKLLHDFGAYDCITLLI